MTDRESFVAAIAANPDDDTPRLAFADWLEENGDAARAGFVRDQVRLARMPAGTEEYRELFKKTGATLRANLPAWIQSACEAFGQPATWEPMRSRRGGLTIGLGKRDARTTLQQGHGLSLGTFERGFLNEAWVCTHCLGDGTPLTRLLRENPITRLTFHFLTPAFSERQAVDGLRQIRSLTLSGFFDRDAASALFSSPAWQSLQYLSLGEPPWHAVTHLCRSPLAKRLRGLRMPMNAEYLRELAGYPLDDTLRELALYPSLDRDQFQNQKPRILAFVSTIPFRPTLKKLVLSRCMLQDAGLALFARGEVWIRLRALALDRNRFGDPGWRDFARGRRTPELRVLTASRNFLTNDGAIRLGESSLVETLEYIDLRGNRIEGKGAMALARSFADSPLKKLLLAGNPIREADANAMRKVLGGRVDIGS